MNPKLDALLYRYSVAADRAFRWEEVAMGAALVGFLGAASAGGVFAVMAAAGKPLPAAPLAALALLLLGLGFGAWAGEIVAGRRARRFEARAGAAVERAVRRRWQRVLDGSLAPLRRAGSEAKAPKWLN